MFLSDKNIKALSSMRDKLSTREVKFNRRRPVKGFAERLADDQGYYTKCLRECHDELLLRLRHTWTSGYEDSDDLWREAARIIKNR